MPRAGKVTRRAKVTASAATRVRGAARQPAVAVTASGRIIRLGPRIPRGLRTTLKAEKSQARIVKRKAARLKIKALGRRRAELHAAAALLEDFHGGKVNKRTKRIETGCGRPRNDGSSRNIAGEKGEWVYMPKDAYGLL